MEIREQANRLGVSNLTVEQLFILVIGSGTSGASVETIVENLAYLSHDFTELDELSQTNLLKIKGIGAANQSRIMAIVELSKRLPHRQKLCAKINDLDCLGKHLIDKYHGYLQEELCVFFLNLNNEIILEKILFRGSLDSATVHPRDVVRQALSISCKKVIVAHNHPSNSLYPSNLDLKFTNDLKRCLELFGIKLLDHLIIGNDDYLSLSNKKIM